MKFFITALFLALVSRISHAFAPQSSTNGRFLHKQPSLSFKQPSLSFSLTRRWSTIERTEETAGVVQSKTNDKEQTNAWEKLDHSSSTAARSHAVNYLKQYEGQSGAAIVYSKLQENGVTVVNGFSGGAVLPLLDQFHEEHPRHSAPGAPTPIRWITNSNENNAGHIAEGYAKSMPLDPQNMPVGVVVATSGPGVTNLITPLQDAICDGVPMVVLCGQAATTAPKDAFQACPAVDLTRPCTKWSYQIKSAAEVPMVMDYAFYMARSGRPGPVFVDLPKDLQNQVINEELIEQFADQNLDGGDAPEDGFLRFQESQSLDGNKFHALNLGYGGQGLPFETVQNGPALKLQPVTYSAEDDTFHADYHPTDKIYWNREGGEAQEGALATSDPVTQELLRLIQTAEKPVIIAGQGCNDSPAELMALAEKLQIPVATTLHALGTFDERHPLALNMLGMHGHPTPNFMVQESDLVLCVGSRFDDRITGRISDFLPEAKKAAAEGRGGIIHVDIRRSENAKQVKPTFFVHATGKQFLRTMSDAVEAAAPVKPATESWLKHMHHLQREFPVKIPEFCGARVRKTGEDGQEKTEVRTPLSAQSVVSRMNEQLLASGKIDEAIFTTGVGIHQMVAAQLITWTQPRQMLSSGSLGTMGVSIGYAIGAKLANGKKLVISVDGDGSFNMTFTELKTIAEQKIPVKILLLDNEGQMMVEYWQKLFHENRLLAVRNSKNPDYVQLAKAFGLKALHCDHEEDLEAKMQEFLFADPEEPVLFHVQIERTPCLPLVAPGQPLQDMILEDVEVEVDQCAAPS